MTNVVRFVAIYLQASALKYKPVIEYWLAEGWPMSHELMVS
jgi:hypothetical protein